MTRVSFFSYFAGTSPHIHLRLFADKQFGTDRALWFPTRKTAKHDKQNGKSRLSERLLF